MMRHNDSRAGMRNGELVDKERDIQTMLRGSEPGHETADVPAGFAVADQPVVIQFLARQHHGCFWRSEQPIIGPERAAEKPDWSDRDMRSVKEMNASASAGRFLEARS